MQESYEDEFRRELIEATTNFLKMNPKFSVTNSDQFKKANEVISYARNKKITPMIVWTNVYEISKSLPESFFSFIFPNRLKQTLDGVLDKYRYRDINLIFVQEQFEQSQRLSQTHQIEVRALKERSANLESQVIDLTKRVKELTEENVKLKESNEELHSENLSLKLTLDKLMSASSVSNEEALRIRQSMSVEIEALKRREVEAKEAMADIVKDKNTFFERCHTLEVELQDLSAKNKRLTEMNSKLLKENFDFQRQVSEFQQIQANPHPRILNGTAGGAERGGLGFFKM